MASTPIFSVRKTSLLNFAKALKFGTGANTSYAPVTLSENGFNIAFWLRYNLVNNLWFLTTATSDNNNGVSCYFNNNRLEVDFRNGASNVATLSSQTVSTRPMLPLGEWFHVVITYVVNSAKLYINGTLIQTDTSCTMSAGAANLYFNRRSQSGNYNNAGAAMSLLYIENSATPWTAAQIELLYKYNKNPGNATYWTLDNTNLDSNGGNALTLAGTSYTDLGPFSSRTAVTGRYAPGMVDFAVKLAGGGYISMGNTAYNFHYDGKISGSAWIYLSTLSSNAAAIFSKEKRTSPYTGWQFIIRSDTKFQFDYDTVDGSNHLRVFSDALTWERGRWYHVGFTYNNQTVKFYRDGVLYPVTTYSINNLTSSYSNTTDFNVGNRDNNTTGDHNLTGIIADPTIWKDIELDAADFATMFLYAFSVNRGEKQYTSRWLFGEGTGTSVADEKGLYAGTITGGTFTPYVARPRRGSGGTI